MNLMAKSARGVAALMLSAVCGASCARAPGLPGCTIDGPLSLLPASVKQVRLGMSKAELERLLGQATYSPIDGQYYFTTGGECPLEATGRHAACGVIAEFRRAPDYRVTDALQSCTWGAIGE